MITRPQCTVPAKARLSKAKAGGKSKAKTLDAKVRTKNVGPNPRSNITALLYIIYSAPSLEIFAHYDIVQHLNFIL